MMIRNRPLVRHAANRVRRALARTNVQVSTRAYRHLVGVICLPVRDRWFRESAVFEPLTQWYRRGVSHPIQSVERAYTLGFVGDAALLTCGYWWEHRALAGGAPHLEELVHLGESAYRNIGDAPFDELASKYSRLVDAMMVLTAHFDHDRDRRVVSLCQVWERDHATRMARILKHLGLPIGLLDAKNPS